VSQDEGVTFGLLGPLLVRDGEGQRLVTSGRQRAVLAALLDDANHVVSTDALADFLWYDRPTLAARSTMHSYVMRLRRALGPILGRRICSRHGGYLAVVHPGELDIQRFGDLAVTGKAALDAGAWQEAATKLDAALELWRGEPYADVQAEKLLRDKACHLDEQRLITVEWRIDAALALGRGNEVIPQLRRLVADHPFRERFAAQLMTALYQADRASEALAVFDSARHSLADELGLDPGPQLAELRQGIIDGGLAIGTRVAASIAALPVPAQLPPGPRWFTGREQVAAELLGHLSSAVKSGRAGAPAMVTIAGMAGIGKTALALHIAHQLRDRFTDGQLYANLRGTTESIRPPAAVLAFFLRSLGIAADSVPGEVAELTALLRTKLADRNVLVLLDDARDAAQVLPLLPASEGCAVIVTSRSRLAQVSGSRFARLGVLADSEALAMFAGLAGAQRVAAEPGAAAAVVRACGHLPRAISIAASRIASTPEWPVAALAERLAVPGQRLTELRAGSVSMRDSLEASYRTLPVTGELPPADAFRMLGLWDGPGLGIAACAALFAKGAAETEEALEALAVGYLAESSSPSRYRLHSLVRAYATERTPAGNGQVGRQAIGRLLAWYLHAGTAASSMLFPGLQPIPPVADLPSVTALPSIATADDAREWYRAEQECTQAAVHLAAGACLDSAAWRLAAVAMRYAARYADSGTDSDTWLSTYEVGLASAQRSGDELGEAWLRREHWRLRTGLETSRAAESSSSPKLP
jgi:DNA-binding SARP family transcriptional activator